MAKPECVKCGEDYSHRRKEAGYDTCLKCGDLEAQEEIKERSHQVAQPYNKGPCMLIGGSSQKLKENAKYIGKK